MTDARPPNKRLQRTGNSAFELRFGGLPASTPGGCATSGALLGAAERPVRSRRPQVSLSDLLRSRISLSRERRWAARSIDFRGASIKRFRFFRVVRIFVSKRFVAVVARRPGPRLGRSLALPFGGCHGRLVRPCPERLCTQTHWQASCQWHPARGRCADARSRRPL